MTFCGFDRKTVIFTSEPMPLKNASTLALTPPPRAANFFISQARSAMRLLRCVGSIFSTSRKSPMA